MDRDKLVELRQKKNDQKRQEHREILESNESIAKSIAKLSESINGMGNYDFNLLNEQLKSLKESSDFGKYVEQIDKSLKEYNEDATTELKNIVDKYGTIQNKALTNAVDLLINKLNKQTVDQNPENYVPYRRVRKIGDRLVFDDDAMRVTVSGGGGGSFSPYVDANGKITNVQLTPDGKVPTDANISFPTGLAIEAKQDDTITAINTGSSDIVDKLDTLTVTAAVDLTQLDRTNYAFYDKAEDTNYKYIAKQSAMGNWYIMRIPKTGVNDITKYAVGSSNLATAWASFATQSYADWDTNNSPTSSGVISMAGVSTEVKQDNTITKIQELSDKLDILLAKPIETIDTVHDHIHDGNSFTSLGVVALTTGQSYTIITNTNDTLRKHSFLQAYLSEELEVTVQEGVTTTSDGTSLPILNRNRNSLTTSTATIFANPTGLVTTGCPIVRHVREGGKNAFAETQQSNELILKANTKYSVTFTNRGNNTAYLNWQWFWYECGDCE